MIKIIKKGKKPIKTKIIYTIKCPYCDCEFECDNEDFTKVEKAINGKRWIKCPCCDKELCLFSDDYTTREEEIIEPIPVITPFNPNPEYDPWRYPSYPDPRGGRYPDPSIKDPCETCPNRFGPTDGLGRPVPGDSPCQWCSHYKWKVTWNDCGNNTANYSTAATRTEDLKDVSKKL